MHARSSASLILVLFAASGLCGLVYQVLWIRLLNLTFGVTTLAMAVVLSSFMAGLALGSALAARYHSRIRAPFLAYAALEAIIGLSALGIPMAVSLATQLRQAWLPLSAGVLQSSLFQALEVSLILLLPTTCMGATLPVLAQEVGKSTAHRGLELGRLYGLNTLGAFAGTVLTGFFAIEWLGITRSNQITAGLNLAVALLAVAIHRMNARASQPLEPPPPQAQTTQHLPDGPQAPLLARVGSSVPRRLLFFSFLCGFTAMAYEVLWTRLISQVALTTTYVFTLVLATVIAGLGLGSLLGGPLADRSKRPQTLFGYLELGVALSVVLVYPLFRLYIAYSPQALEERIAGFGPLYLYTGLMVGSLILPAALCMGATFPVLARLVSEGSAQVTRAVGRLYAVNTVGCILGSLAGGFILLPFLGILPSILLMALVNLAMGLYAAWPASSEPLTRRLVFLAMLGTFVGCSITGSQISLADLFQARLPPGSRILALVEGVVSTVMVADVSEPRVRRTWINSAWVAGTGGSHKMLGHLPLLMVKKPKDVLGIAFGTGQSFGTTLLHQVDRIDCVDLNPDVVRLGLLLFSEANHQLLKSPKAKVYLLDGRDFVARTTQRYDAVIMEPLQPWSAGAVSLYTREFYHQLRQVLRPGGVVAQWLPIDDLTPQVTRWVIGTFAAELPYTYVFLDNYDLWFVGSAEPLAFDLAQARGRLQGPVLADLNTIDYPDLESILATLVLTPADLPGYAGSCGRDCLSDDRPYLEFVAPRQMHGAHLEANLQAIRKSMRGGPWGVQADGVLPRGLESGDLARLLLDGSQATDANRWEVAQQAFRQAWRLAPSVGRSLRFYRAATARLGLNLAREGRLQPARALFEAHLAEDPDFAGGWLNLALVQARLGDQAGARGSLDRAAQDPALADRVQTARGAMGL